MRGVHFWSFFPIRSTVRGRPPSFLAVLPLSPLDVEAPSPGSFFLLDFSMGVYISHFPTLPSVSPFLFLVRRIGGTTLFGFAKRPPFFVSVF